MLQTCVQAVLLGSTVTDMDWSSKGILAKSCVEEWPLKGWSPQEKGVASGMASDGLYLYLHGSHGLAKVGSGYGNTKKVRGFSACMDQCQFSVCMDQCPVFKCLVCAWISASLVCAWISAQCSGV